MCGAASLLVRREQRDAVVAEFMLQLVIVLSLGALTGTLVGEIVEWRARGRADRRRKAAARKAASQYSDA